MAKDAFGYPLSQVYGPTDETMDSAYTVQGTTYAHFNKGLDYAAESGSLIKTPVGGKVVEAGFSDSWGNYIKIKDSQGIYHQFSHMSEPTKFKVGQTVSKGNLVGYVGSTGASTGPHLSYDVQNNGGQYIDPLSLPYVSKALPTVNHSNASNLKMAAQAGFATTLGVPSSWRPQAPEQPEAPNQPTSGPATPAPTAAPGPGFTVTKQNGYVVITDQFGDVIDTYKDTDPEAGRTQFPSEAALDTAQAAKQAADAEAQALVNAGKLIDLGDGRYLIPTTGAVVNFAAKGQFKQVEGLPGYYYDSSTGEVLDTMGNQIQQGQLDFTKQKFATEFPEQVRQFNEQIALDRQKLGLDKDRFGLEQSKFGENQFQFDVTAAQTARDQDLQESQFVADILRNPSDALARGFFQRGENSPLPVVGQADLLNMLGKAGTSTIGRPGAAPGGVAPTRPGAGAPGALPGTPAPAAAPGFQVNQNGVPYQGGFINGQPAKIGQAATLADLASGAFQPGPGGFSVGVGAGSPDTALAERLVAEGKLVKVGTINGSTQYVTPEQAAATRAGMTQIGGQGVPVTPPVPGPAGAPPVTAPNPSGFTPTFGNNGESAVIPAGGGAPIATPPPAAFAPPVAAPPTQTGGFQVPSQVGGVPINNVGMNFGGQPGAALGSFGFDNAMLGLTAASFAAPRFAAGSSGFIPAPHEWISGDPQRGNQANPEHVELIDPTNDAQLRVTPMNRAGPPQFAFGTWNDEIQNANDQKRYAAAPAATSGFSVPSGAPSLSVQPTGPVTPYTPTASPSPSGSVAAAPASSGAAYTPPAPAVPGQGFSQQQLVDQARQLSVPAVRDVLAGSMPSALRFNFPLMTPAMLAALTPSEREALNARLAYEGPGGTTLNDVEFGVRQQFGARRQRPRGRFLL